MLTFSINSLLIFTYLLSINCIKINEIQNARIINSTSNFQSNCSACICQCITYSLPSCCYVNCYINNNTCQLIISSSTNNPTMIIDTTTTVYSTNCSDYSYITTKSSLINPKDLVDIDTTPKTTSKSQTTTTLAHVKASTSTYTTPWWCPACGRR